MHIFVCVCKDTLLTENGLLDRALNKCVIITIIIIIFLQFIYILYIAIIRTETRFPLKQSGHHHSSVVVRTVSISDVMFFFFVLCLFVCIVIGKVVLDFRFGPYLRRGNFMHFILILILSLAYFWRKRRIYINKGDVLAPLITTKSL